MLDLIQTRRALHQIPEIGLEEFKTQAYLLDVIEKLTTGKDFVQIALGGQGFWSTCRKSARANHWLADRY